MLCGSLLDQLTLGGEKIFSVTVLDWYMVLAYHSFLYPQRLPRVSSLSPERSHVYIYSSLSLSSAEASLGSCRNDDGDGNGNEDVKKAIGLLRKTTTLHVHHAFLYISLPSLHDYDVKMPNCKFNGGRKQATTNLLFSL